MPRVVVSIVSWNHARYLPEALASVRRQTHPDLSLVVVDNASSDGTSDLVRNEYPEATLLRNIRNLGFSRAHNQAIDYARANLRRDGEDLFVLVMNPDIVLQPDCIARLMDRMAHRRDIGSAGCKLLRMHERQDGDLTERDFSDVVDSTGLRIFRTRRTADIGSGETDSDFGRTGEVFGPSGALALFRVSALEDVSLLGEFFDEDLFAYKEDADLSWRLKLRGWKSIYVPDAVAYHHRRIKGKEKASLLSIVRGRRGRSKFVSRLSYRNHLMLLIKNEHLTNLLLDLPWIATYELRKAVYMLLFEPTTYFPALSDVVRRLPRMMRKRRLTMRSAKLRARDIRKWLR
ncbi:MAG: glycosyltransferase family 2 protein [bacterium]